MLAGSRAPKVTERKGTARRTLPYLLGRPAPTVRAFIIAVGPPSRPPALIPQAFGPMPALLTDAYRDLPGART